MKKFRPNEKQRLGELALRRHLEGEDRQTDLESVLEYLKGKQTSTEQADEIVITIRLPKTLENILTTINELINRPAAASTPAPSLPEIFVREQRNMRKELDEIKLSLDELKASKQGKRRTNEKIKRPVYYTTVKVGEFELDNIPCRMWRGESVIAYDALTDQELVRVLRLMRDKGYDVAKYNDFKRAMMLSLYHECRRRAIELGVSHKDFIDLLGL